MKILTINYSQSGQLHEIVDNFIKPFHEHDIDRIKIEPEKQYPFPWDRSSFFDTVPESVLEINEPLKSFNFKHEIYDLIILGYQPWNLSPSIPTTALLENLEFRKRLDKTNVITLVAGRNMWLNAHRCVSKKLTECNAIHSGNYIYMDRSANLVSAVTIQHWMFSGKKSRFLGVFPLPGVSDLDIKGAENDGELAKNFINNNKLNELQSELIDQGIIYVKTDLLFIESRAKKIFTVWANLIAKQTSESKRKFILKLYQVYLNVALFIIAPIILISYLILFRPFISKSLTKQKLSYMVLNN